MWGAGDAEPGTDGTGSGGGAGGGGSSVGSTGAVAHAQTHAALASLELAGIRAVLQTEKEVEAVLRKLAVAGIYPESALASIRDEFQHLSVQRQRIREAAEEGVPPRSVIESLVREFSGDMSYQASKGKKSGGAGSKSRRKPARAEHRLAKQASTLTRLVSEDTSLLARSSRVADLRLELQFCSFKLQAMVALVPDQAHSDAADDDYDDDYED
jgi:hypothetical protein